MTLSLMKALGLHFSTFLFGLCLIGGAETADAATTPCATPERATSPNDGGKQGYPTFCSIPLAPTHLRPPAVFRDAVLDTRRAGRDIVRESGPDSFGLAVESAAPFASQARREAAPPPPMNPQEVIEAEAFAREARKRAAPPKSPH